VCVMSIDVFMVTDLSVFILHMCIRQCAFCICVFIGYLFDSVETVVCVCTL